MITSKNSNFTAAFDIGHSSIGWSVFEGEYMDAFPKAAGVVVIPPGIAMTTERANMRRSRRHVKATRERIALLSKYFVARGLISEDQSKPKTAFGHSQPWLLAARALLGYQLLSGVELWNVIRWYAHNRGYDGNASWSRSSEEEKKEDSEKVDNADSLMKQFGTGSMAETICAYLEIDIELPKKRSSRKYFKGENVAFRRDVVVSEVRQILQQHIGKHQGVDSQLIIDLLEQIPPKDRFDHHFPKNYEGGLLMGQKIPRFNNRIIPVCPVSGQKKPLRHDPLFFRFRWAMYLLDLRVERTDASESKLTVEELKRLDRWGRSVGRFTPTNFRKAVEEITHCQVPQLDKRLMTDEMAEGIGQVDFVKAAIMKVFGTIRPMLEPEDVDPLWEVIPDPVRNRLFNRASRTQTQPTLRGLQIDSQKYGISKERFDTVVADLYEKIHSKKTKSTPSLDAVFQNKIILDRAHGRAPYSREVMKTAVHQIYEGIDPRSPDQALYIDEKRRRELEETPIDQLTNNHLVRHRLKIFEKLLNDIRKDFETDNQKLRTLTIEVIRDLTEFSGLNDKEKAILLNSKTKHHGKVATWLQNKLHELGKDEFFSASLIRKARIGDDLNWTCPYTGQIMCVQQLLNNKLELDHIIPRSQRQSDSMESLVLTFREVNEMKGNRTALQFIHDEASHEVPGRPNWGILPESRYLDFVSKLKPPTNSPEDQRRQKRRQRLLKTLSYDKRDREFTDAELVQTSHLNKLAAAVAGRLFDKDCKPRIIHIPGSVTGAIRQSWRLNGLLGAVLSDVLVDPSNPGQGVKPKHEIRNITHLHHAVDAIALGFAAARFPADKEFYKVLSSRHVDREHRLPWEDLVRFSVDGSPYLKPLADSVKKEVIRCLAEKRVIYHIPKTMKGVKTEQTIWGVGAQLSNGKIEIFQYEDLKDQKNRRIGQVRRRRKRDSEWPGKLLGYEKNSVESNLGSVRGAIQVKGNFGVTLEADPKIIPFSNVYRTLNDLGLKDSLDKILRQYDIIELKCGKYVGIWRVLSVKNTEAYGVSIDMIKSDRVYRKGMKLKEGFKNNYPVKDMVRDGVVKIVSDYCGV